MKTIPPVIKWSGSKRLVAPMLSQYVRSAPKYYEPFVGGGAMLPFAKSKQGFASDIIPELIDLWNNIKINPEKVSEEYALRWNDLQQNGADVFYRIRDSFNKTRNCFDFLFLTRTCVNGKIRYNKNREFNNAFHLTRPGINPETLRAQLLQWSLRIQKIVFRNVDYRECLSTVSKGDFVFLDPPYGGTKDFYTLQEFDFNALYSELERLTHIGAFWMLTFDGNAGKRTYDFAPPKDIYKHKFLINTGNSAFKKLMDNETDSIYESVYLNFEPVNESPSLFDNIGNNA